MSEQKTEKQEKEIECCKKCTFVFKRLEDVPNTSNYTRVDAFFCRRYPPSTIGIIRVVHDGWCGEWKEKVSEEKS